MRGNSIRPVNPDTLRSSHADEIFSSGQAVRAEIARLHLHTRRSLNSDIAGQYRTAFRGQGLIFSDIREYQPGDDTKHIHWKASARTGKIYVKSFEEERELRIMLSVDISRSGNFGRKKSNFQKAVEFAAAVTMLAETLHDSVGLCLFSDAVHEFIPPARSRFNFHRIVEALCDDRPFAPRTDPAPMFQFLNEKCRRHTVIFVISDFYSRPFLTPLKSLALRHDVILVAVLDEVEMKLPRAGLIEFRDAELGGRMLVDTSAPSAADIMRKYQMRRLSGLSQTAAQAGADFIVVSESSVRPLVELMKARIRRLR